MMFRRTRSYPPEIRERARELRRAGFTYPEIIAELGGDVPQPTVQGWVRDIELTTEQKARIKQLELEGARRAQPLGAEWNRKRRQASLERAQTLAKPIAKRLSADREALQLMAASLYVGEGGKRTDHVAFSNSDPRVIQTWMTLLRRNFEIDEGKFACQLMLSIGMPEQDLITFWSTLTGIPVSRFHKSSIKQTPASVQRPGYRGVCMVRYYSADVRRFLDALAQGVMDEILQDDSREL
jgi:hypothetical protein